MQISCDGVWVLTWLSPPDYQLWNVPTGGSACDREPTTLPTMLYT